MQARSSIAVVAVTIAIAIANVGRLMHSEFSDAQLRSDYFLLEEVSRLAGQSQRDRLCSGGGQGGGGRGGRKGGRRSMPSRLSLLLRECGRRHIDLRLMPHGMSRRVQNRTYSAR